MTLQENNTTKVVNDSNSKVAIQSPNESPETLVNRAREIMASTADVQDLPKLTDVAKSEDEWNKKYAGHEEKKASYEHGEGYPTVWQIAGDKGLPIDHEIKFENYRRYPTIMKEVKSLGYNYTEVRLFALTTGTFEVTDLQGDPLVDRTPKSDRLQSIENKLDEVLDYLKDEEVAQEVVEDEEVTKNELPYNLKTIISDDEEIAVTTERLLTKERRIVNEYISGTAMKDIQEEFDVSAGTIYGILNKNDVNLRSTGSSKGMAGVQVNHYLEDENKRKQLIRAYTDNVLTLEEIYIGFDINKNGLFFILDRFKVPRRSPTRIVHTLAGSQDEEK